MLLKNELLETGKKLIIKDMISGTVPSKVKSFSQLHDYVDANAYLTNNFHYGMSQVDVNDLNFVGRELNAWLKKSSNKNVGYHAPILTKKYLNIINLACELEFRDVSWKNDLADSLCHDFKTTEDKFITIYLPNSDVQDENEELFNHFTISDENFEPILNSEDINDIINYINSNY